MRVIRPFVLAVLSLLIVSLALPVLAAEDEGADAVPAESDAVESIQPAYEPAVIVEEAVDAEDEQPWTTKFLVPTGLVLAVVAVFSTVLMYFLRVVRTRYKVVE